MSTVAANVRKCIMTSGKKGKSMLQCNCPFANICWRNAYSRYLLDNKYNIPPERLLLFSAGYATIEMMPNKGIFAENMPLFRDVPINLCPALDGGFTLCPEYRKETKRRENLERGRQRRIQYNNARPRVSIPQEIRRAVAKRDKYRCVYCGRYQNQLWNGTKIQCVVDHIVPLALGGHESDTNNLAFCCRDCNQAKGSSLWEMACRVGFYEER